MEKFNKEKREKEKKRFKEEERNEKRRQKEEERLRRQAEKKKKKQMKHGSSGPSVEDFAQSESNFIPLFVEKCIDFIEEEGLDSEGIYRVPGNRAQVDLLFHKFDEGICLSIF